MSSARTSHRSNVVAGVFLLASIAASALLVPQHADADERYRFPISIDPRILAWDEHHWDATLAVDIWIHPEFRLDAPERRRFYESDVVAVVDGTASRLDNPRGGIAVVLHGDDDRTYYYAHLAESRIDATRRVRRGETLGTIGRTGSWTQYLEPHLHLSIAQGHQVGTDWTADIDPVFWLQRTFGLSATPTPRNAYPPTPPEGSPLFGHYDVTRSFATAAGEDPYLAGATLVSVYPRNATIRSPLTGTVRIHRDTILGVRIQVSNGEAGWSVILSGDIQPIVRTGDIAYRDTVLGHVNGPLHYMAFRSGTPVDPLANRGTAGGDGTP